jgi:hypothetical protein
VKAKLTTEQKAAYRDKTFGPPDHPQLFRVQKQKRQKALAAVLVIGDCHVYHEELPELARAAEAQKAMQAELDRRAELRRGK